MRALLLIPLLAMAGGCVSDATRQDVSDLAQASYNAAASLPLTPQAQAIKDAQQAIGDAMGHPIVTVPK